LDGDHQLTSFKEVRINLIERTELILATIQDDILRPILNEKPTYWRLTIPGLESYESEELVWSIQGVIANKDLPPILNR
jgi:hypothetical protein